MELSSLSWNVFNVFLKIALECNRDEWVARMRRMGSCPCQQLGRPIARFHSNPSGKCLFGRSAALQRLSIAGLWTAHCALHPIPKRHLCNSKKTLNTFLAPQITIENLDTSFNHARSWPTVAGHYLQPTAGSRLVAISLQRACLVHERAADIL